MVDAALATAPQGHRQRGREHGVGDPTEPGTASAAGTPVGAVACEQPKAVVGRDWKEDALGAPRRQEGRVGRRNPCR